MSTSSAGPAVEPGGEFAPGLRSDGIHIVTTDPPELAEWLLAEIDAAGARRAARAAGSAAP